MPRSAFQPETLEPRLFLAAHDEAPTVSASPDLNIHLSEVAALVGEVHDDSLSAINALGQAEGESTASESSSTSPLNIAWRRIRGPEGLTFEDFTNVETTAAFDAVGEYLLRLEVNDGQWTTVDYVTVNVTMDQQPLVVSAGDDLTVTFPSDAQLAAHIIGNSSNAIAGRGCR